MNAAEPIRFRGRQITLRTRAVAVRYSLRTVVVCTMLAVVALLLCLIGLMAGDLVLSPAEVFQAISDPSAGIVHTVVADWRMPRVLAGLLFGAAMGASGAVFQSLTRNPIASPDVIGLTSGSYAGGLAAIVFLGGGFVATAAGALGGGALTACAVYLLAYRRSILGFRLIIVGVAISAMLTAASTYLLMRTRVEVAMAASVWGAGTLADVGWVPLGLTGLGLAAAFTVLVLASGALRRLELGDDLAAALGTRVEAARFVLIAAGVALTALVTAVTGPIAFIALAAPQIARRLTSSHGLPLLPSALFGAVLLAASDLIAQHVMPTPLPVGIVTIAVGGVYLIWMLLHESRRKKT